MRPCSSPFALRTMSALLLKVLDSVVALFAAPGGYSVLTPGRLEVFCHRLSPTAGGGGTTRAQRSGESVSSLAGLAVHGGHEQPCFYGSPDSSSHEMSQGLCGFQLSNRITNLPQQWGFHSS